MTNSKNILAAIAELLNDEAMRKRLGKAAREKILKVFDAEVTIVELQKLFRQLVAERDEI